MHLCKKSKGQVLWAGGSNKMTVDHESESRLVIVYAGLSEAKDIIKRKICLCNHWTCPSFFQRAGQPCLSYQ